MATILLDDIPQVAKLLDSQIVSVTVRDGDAGLGELPHVVEIVVKKPSIWRRVWPWYWQTHVVVLTRWYDRLVPSLDPSLVETVDVDVRYEA
jgi:hypothetical protein